jgi:hypothetical protein
VQQERIIEQLEKMAASGRITPEDAARLRTAAGTAEFDIAEAASERVRGGEHSAALRTRIRGTG